MTNFLFAFPEEELFSQNRNSSQNIKERDNKVLKVESDTIVNGNKIEKVWNNGQDRFIIKLLIIGNKEQPIRLSLVNLIGKEVKEIYSGTPMDSSWEYSFTYAEIPSGVYICVLSSANYRDAKKIVISK
ncbi:MAG: hypothetical protein A2X64_09045 [Ignavibacteria bacterium GWF2_33_9]|nr:MAG: hypothetical protein A2X64_09045 [Ignavibacteria bacterium GWF2_33_9]